MIKGNVIKIIDEYRIVVNIGKNTGVEIGDKIIIYLEGEEIVDPTTNESLGILDYIKSTLDVEQVFDRFIICAKKVTREKEIEKNRFLSRTISPFESRKEIEKIDYVKQINVDKSSITGYGIDTNKTITIGDSARIIDK